MQLALGVPVRCTDEPCGHVADVVIDPTSRRVTHVVVNLSHGHAGARLVPIGLAGPSQDEKPGLVLSCTTDDVLHRPTVQETAYLRLGEFVVDDPAWDVGVETVLAEPYYGYGTGYVGQPSVDPHMTVAYDRIPKGEVEIRRRSRVTSADGHDLGHADGFLVDGDGLITHMVLERGHLWTKRDVTIPIGAVTDLRTDAVALRLTRDEVGDLAPVPVHRWQGE
jgi:hypothetical protein